MLRRTLAFIAVFAAAGAPAQAQDHPGLRRIAAGSILELRQWDQRIDTMLRDGELRVQRVAPDPDVAGRTHERATQSYKGIRVDGADVTRQLASGQTVSMFGVLYSGINLSVSPTLTSTRAADILRQLTGRTLGPARMPELTVLPTGGGYALAWRARVATPGGVTLYFLDAHSGKILKQRSDLQTQAAVGNGRGVLGDQKKMSVRSSGSEYVAVDDLRPPDLTSYDMHGNLDRMIDILNGAPIAAGDVASDSDNTWTDAAVVDAHSYAGFTYDYYFKRYGRRGLDDRNSAVRSFVHPVSRADLFSYPPDVIGTFYVNAFYCCGGFMVYGEGIPGGYTLDGQYVDYQSGALDVIAHELTHGVTDYTSALEYENQSGALNEAFSDIMATSVEFSFQSAGSGLRQAEYLIGEDTWRPGGIRSMANPRAFGDPDHFSKRYTGTRDNGGVHTNSGIANNAFYLAIEGGTNSTSRIAVAGVGGGNREQIEKVFYRAFTLMLPARATFATARAATIQAARDLYGAGSAAERAVTQAWTAVGVN